MKQQTKDVQNEFNRRLIEVIYIPSFLSKFFVRQVDEVTFFGG